VHSPKLNGNAISASQPRLIEATLLSLCHNNESYWSGVSKDADTQLPHPAVYIYDSSSQLGVNKAVAAKPNSVEYKGINKKIIRY
jgi:hypothetical protein